jgi:hypothetical protein
MQLTVAEKIIVDYAKRVVQHNFSGNASILYQRTPHLRKYEDALDVLLGKGWYCISNNRERGVVNFGILHEGQTMGKPMLWVNTTNDRLGWF